MRQKGSVLLAVGLLLLLGACGSLGQIGGGSQPLPTLAPVFAEHPLHKAPYNIPRDSAPLLARYYWLNDFEHGGHRQTEAQYWGLTYQPRQSNYQGYEKWDVLEVETWTDETRADWLRLQLNRDARVVVVWEGSALWLSGWQKGSLTLSGKAYNTYARDFARGEIALGPPAKDGPRYFVLLGEKGGAASAEPPLPAGITERPRPNQACPSWLSNVWTYKQVYGEFKEGEDYKTWRPQLDPLYWCYYGSEYGSDPAWVGYRPAFGYVARKFNDQAELDVGFKGFAVRDEGAGLGWYFNIHSETGVQTRACARFHTVVVAVTSLRSGELLAELGYKGDFGATLSNQGGNAPVNITCTDPRTGQQTTQAQIAQQTEASKNMRVFSGGSDPGGYENWHGGGNTALGMSFWGDDKGGGKGNAFNIDIRNPATGCNSSACTATVPTGQSATERTLFVANLKLRYSAAVEALDKKDGAQDGYFWTDLYGDPLAAGVSPGDRGTIRQYMKPGFASAPGGGDGLQGFFTSEDAWRQVYMRDGGVPNLELEDSIGDQN